ncbi:hypothetical protein MNAN1_000190 [Malassezia nana]|uniref:BZIP transcription factor n=1 Tax=Malassezia nana TaxID=180528 RepID=A0AAF0J0S5_9BASI|nr:hypothetical protein MNAN1_000190 [Malassezia nana]
MSVTNVPAIDPILLVRAESTRHVSPSSSILSSSPSPPPLLKRSADEELTTTYPNKGSRSSEEEKLALSREKKKAYVDQLEHDVAVLRAEKQASELRERMEASKRLELEGRITDLNAKVVQLESVLSMLLKMGGNALSMGLQSRNASADEVQKDKNELSVDGAYVSLLNSAQASAAPDAVSTLVANAHSMESRSDPCTRLPAVKATSSSSTDDELALQRFESSNALSLPAVSTLGASNGSSLAFDDIVEQDTSSFHTDSSDSVLSSAHVFTPAVLNQDDASHWGARDSDAAATIQNTTGSTGQDVKEILHDSTGCLMDETTEPDLSLLVSSFSPSLQDWDGESSNTKSYSSGQYDWDAPVISTTASLSTPELNAPLFPTYDYIDVDVPLPKEPMDSSSMTLGHASHPLACL